MSNEKLEQAQLDIANQLITAMNKLAEKADRISNAFRTQSDVINDINDSFEKMEEKLSDRENSINDFTDAASKAQQKIEETADEGGKFVSFVKDMQKGIDELGAGVWTMNALWGNFQRPLTNIREGIIKIAQKSKVLNSIGRGFKNLSKNWKNYNEAMKNSNGFLERTVIRLKAVKELTGFLMGGVSSLLKSAVSNIGGIVSSIVNVVKTSIGMVTKFIELAITLPFQIAQSAASIGGKLRQELFEVVIQAGEETKQYFDQTSDIGQGMKSLTGIAAGSLLSFQSVNSEVTKLFGYGAQGAANMIKETAENINAMGHFSEIFAGTITKDSKSIKFLAKAQRALGLSSEDFGYLALDAASNSEGLKTTIAKTADVINYVAKNSGVDFKRLSINFFKLRKDITNFGHLTNTELSNLTAKMTQMGVKMEDAAALFNKFGTFEDAANASAMLSQTFGMNVDAMDLLQAQNPGEIIDMFRNAMFETGRSFDDLNRHEKSLMSQHTGMSSESLKMIMNFRRMGYSYAESKKMMEDQKPEARQLKALKGLNSSITQFQKTLNFKSPFEAFFSGLSKALAFSPELRKVTQLLSGSYEGIYEFALGLKGDDFKGIVTPIIEVVKVMKSVFGSKEFKTGVRTVLSGISDFISGIAGYTTKSESLNWSKTFNNSIKAAAKDKKNKKALNSIIPEYENIFKKKDYKSLLKKAGINERQLKGLTLKSTSNILKRLEKVVDKNPEYRNAYKKLGDTITDASKGITGFKLKETDKKGILNIVNGFVESMDKAVKTSGKSGSAVADLSGKMMGLIIKGGAMFGLALLKLVNVGLRFADSKVTGNENPLLKWLKISKEEYNEIKTGYKKAFDELFKESEKTNKTPFMSVVGTFTSLIVNSLTSAFSGVASFVTDAILRIFGVTTESTLLTNLSAKDSISSLSLSKNVNQKEIPSISLPSLDEKSVDNTYGSGRISQVEALKEMSGNTLSKTEIIKFNKFINVGKTSKSQEDQILASFKAQDVLAGTGTNATETYSNNVRKILREMRVNSAYNSSRNVDIKVNNKKLILDKYSMLKFAIDNKNNTNLLSKEASKSLREALVNGSSPGKPLYYLFKHKDNLIKRIETALINKSLSKKSNSFSSNAGLTTQKPGDDKIIKSFGYLLDQKTKKKETEDGFGTSLSSFMPLDSTSLFKTGGSLSLGTTILGETYDIYEKSKELKLKVFNKKIEIDNIEDQGLSNEDVEVIMEMINNSINDIGESLEVDLVNNLDFKKFMYEAKKYLDIWGNPHGAYAMRLSNESFVNPSHGNTTPTMDFDINGRIVG